MDPISFIIPVHVRIQYPLTIYPIFFYRYVYVRIQSLLTVHQSFYLMHAVKISLDRSPQLIVVNKQRESHKGLIFYLHEVQLVYNDVHHSPPTLLLLSCYLSSFFGVLPRLQKPEINSPYQAYLSLNTALLASQPYARRVRISRLAPVLKKNTQVLHQA